MKSAEELLREKGITEETKHHAYTYLYNTFVELLNNIIKENYAKESERTKEVQ